MVCKECEHCKNKNERYIITKLKQDINRLKRKYNLSLEIIGGRVPCKVDSLHYGEVDGFTYDYKLQIKHRKDIVFLKDYFTSESEKAALSHKLLCLKVAINRLKSLNKKEAI